MWRRRWIGSARLTAGAAFAVALSALAAPAQAEMQPIADFGGNPGALNAYIYVPNGLPAGAPLVVALHGCSQQARDFDNETGFTAAADAHKFALLFPEQRSDNNLGRCFNFFEKADAIGSAGEAGSIRNMILHVLSSYGLNDRRVFIAGLSAGGGMTSVMLANFPGLFAGGAIVAGTPYLCATPSWWEWTIFNPNVWTRLWFQSNVGFAMSNCGVSLEGSLFSLSVDSRKPSKWGDFVRGASNHAGPWPKISLWQGTDDGTVDPDNLDELSKQWADLHGIADRLASPSVRQQVAPGIVRETFADGAGVQVIERYRLENFGHAFPVDPDGSPTCGVSVNYIADADICAVSRIVAFWGLNTP